MQEYRHRYSDDMVVLKVNEIMLEQLPQVSEVFAEGLKAKKFENVGGRRRSVPDHSMRLKTVNTLKSLRESTQPKAPLVQNNTQFNQSFPGGSAGHSGLSFEARLRRIRQERGIATADETIIEGEEDQPEDQSLEDELADIGVDLEEADDEATP